MTCTECGGDITTAAPSLTRDQVADVTGIPWVDVRRRMSPHVHVWESCPEGSYTEAAVVRYLHSRDRSRMDEDAIRESDWDWEVPIERYERDGGRVLFPADTEALLTRVEPCGSCRAGIILHEGWDAEWSQTAFQAREIMRSSDGAIVARMYAGLRIEMEATWPPGTTHILIGTSSSVGNWRDMDRDQSIWSSGV